MGKKLDENLKKATDAGKESALDKRNVAIVYRINEILDDKQLSVNNFSKLAKINQRTANRQLSEFKTFVDTKTILAIIDLIPNCNLEWVLWGKQPKIKETAIDIPALRVRESDGEYVKITDSAIPVFNPLLDIVNPLDVENEEEKTAYKHITLPRKSKNEFVVVAPSGKVTFTNATDLSYIHLERLGNWQQNLLYKRVYFIEIYNQPGFFAELQRSRLDDHISILYKNPKAHKEDIPISNVKQVSRVIGIYEQI